MPWSGQARNGTALREVGVFLPRFNSTPRGRIMAYGFRPDSGRICMVCVIVGWLLFYDGQRPISRGFVTVRDRTLCSGMAKSRAEWQTEVCLNFHTIPGNRQCQLRTAITFPSELRFPCSWTLRKACEV